MKADNEPRKWHLTVAGNVEDAIAHGLTIKAKCGLVFVPKMNERSKDTGDLENCPVCHVEKPGYVYWCYDTDDRLVYVGCSVAPRTRIDQHRKSSWWFDQVKRTRFVVYPNKDKALAVESEAIRLENPRWNVRGRDRGLWTADDYRDAHFAMRQNGASEKRLERLTFEAHRRFRIDLADEVSA